MIQKPDKRNIFIHGTTKIELQNLIEKHQIENQSLSNFSVYILIVFTNYIGQMDDAALFTALRQLYKKHYNPVASDTKHSIQLNFQKRYDDKNCYGLYDFIDEYNKKTRVEKLKISAIVNIALKWFLSLNPEALPTISQTDTSQNNLENIQPPTFSNLIQNYKSLTKVDSKPIKFVEVPIKIRCEQNGEKYYKPRIMAMMYSYLASFVDTFAGENTQGIVVFANDTEKILTLRIAYYMFLLNKKAMEIIAKKDLNPKIFRRTKTKIEADKLESLKSVFDLITTPKLRFSEFINDKSIIEKIKGIYGDICKGLENIDYTFSVEHMINFLFWLEEEELKEAHDIAKIYAVTDVNA